MIFIIQENKPKDIQPTYQLGDIKSHKRYGYRGVIVHADPFFQGEGTRYISNQTQSIKQQPWYFVLVDSNQQVTYVAKENLSHDMSRNQILHPMLNLFSSAYDAELN